MAEQKAEWKGQLMAALMVAVTVGWKVEQKELLLAELMDVMMVDMMALH